MTKRICAVFSGMCVNPHRKGYNPVNKIVGYLLTEDPTYITQLQQRRSMICKIDRDELMQVLVHDTSSKEAQ